MAGKQKSKRNIKKEVRRLFERSFDMDQLNYKKLSLPTKPKSLLIGLGSASALYAAGFALAYIAMEKNILPLEEFAKLSWIILIPVTIVGVTAWQISKNRMEYPIRQKILTYMAALEKDGGLLWKFSPLMDVIGIEDTDTKKALTKSREGKVDELAVEDYTEAVEKLNQVLLNTDNRYFSNVIAEAILENFDKS
ncbi:MAG TPA: hypothetical protein ENK06_02505 [Gammaproteobacteria bacterium]|nr:hypothetical protein [Gammaproteobacteria bacterium]